MHKTAAIRGSLFGGAAGDALGYPIEFETLQYIQKTYGPQGLTKLLPNERTGKALVSDDTQMTLFTANGLLCALAQGTDPAQAIYRAYLDWYATQTDQMKAPPVSWLLEVEGLHALRAPGTSCMHALGSGAWGTPTNPINDSKGCGGVMRVAPIGLCPALVEKDLDQAIRLGAEAAALTHGHPLGWLSAAALVHIVARAAFGGCPYGDGLYGIVQECRETLFRLYPDFPETEELDELLDETVEMARGDIPDEDCLLRLGEGWVAEEALAVALFCALRHPDNLPEALCAAVNHDGDSDSTGAICGNILGAWLGDKAIPAVWMETLELTEVIEAIACDLEKGCAAGEGRDYRKP